MRMMLAVVLLLAVVGPAAAQERPTPPTFAPVTEKVKAAVVSVVMPDANEYSDREEELSDNEALRRLFDALMGLPNRTLGAAVIVDASGIAVTAARILRSAGDVDIVTIDGHRYRATVLGRDDRTDVAVLRIQASRALPALRLADSDDVHVGDWVLAVGSPYGYNASVSAGIVSARARVAADGAYGDLLQTDAAINPGSAGGPLVNTRGDVVALAVTAAPRGAGIAFGLTSNVVRKVVSDIRAHGHVVRSWLGVAPQVLTAELAAAFRVPFTGGVLLADVVAGGPGAKAGLARGDIVVAFDQRALRTLADLERELTASVPGQTRTLQVWRRAREHEVRVVLSQEPDVVASVRRHWGLALEGVTPEIGVVVLGTQPGSAASNAGFLRADILREVNGRTIRTLLDLEEAAAAVTPGRSVTVLVQRDGKPFYLVLETDDRKAEAR